MVCLWWGCEKRHLEGRKSPVGCVPTGRLVIFLCYWKRTSGNAWHKMDLVAVSNGSFGYASTKPIFKSDLNKFGSWGKFIQKPNWLSFGSEKMTITTKLIDRRLEYWSYWTYPHFSRAFTQTAHNRKCFITGQGRIGIGPPCMEVTDLVSLLFGG